MFPGAPHGTLDSSRVPNTRRRPVRSLRSSGFTVSPRLTLCAPFAAACFIAMMSSIATLHAAPLSEFVDPHPAPDNQFGAQVVPLTTGNVVITSPKDDVGGTDAGAVYLFNGATGALISTLRGSTGDEVGSWSVTAL